MEPGAWDGLAIVLVGGTAVVGARLVARKVIARSLLRYREVDEREAFRGLVFVCIATILLATAFVVIIVSP